MGPMPQLVTAVLETERELLTCILYHIRQIVTVLADCIICKHLHP